MVQQYLRLGIIHVTLGEIAIALEDTYISLVENMIEGNAAVLDYLNSNENHHLTKSNSGLPSVLCSAIEVSLLEFLGRVCVF